MISGGTLTFAPLGPEPGHPVFLLRRAGSDDVARLRSIMAALGRPFHDTQAMRDEALEALSQLWSPDIYGLNVPRLRRNWIRIDAGRRLAAAEQRDVDNLTGRLAAAWPRLGAMVLENANFARDCPDVALSLILAGWSGLAVPFRLAMGRVPPATLARLESGLRDQESELGREPGTAWMEVRAAAVIRFGQISSGGGSGTADNHSATSLL